MIDTRERNLTNVSKHFCHIAQFQTKIVRTSIRVLHFEHNFMVLKLGQFGIFIRNMLKVLKCGAGERFRSVSPIV
jgi:hypothetical protein